MSCSLQGITDQSMFSSSLLFVNCEKSGLWDIIKSINGIFWKWNNQYQKRFKQLMKSWTLLFLFNVLIWEQSIGSMSIDDVWSMLQPTLCDDIMLIIIIFVYLMNWIITYFSFNMRTLKIRNYHLHNQTFLFIFIFINIWRQPCWLDRWMEGITRWCLSLCLGLTHSWEFQLLLLVFSSVLYVASMTGNILIVFSVTTDPHLHSPMYFLLASLSFIDLGACSVTSPKMIHDLFRKRKVISFEAVLLRSFSSMSSVGWRWCCS